MGSSNPLVTRWEVDYRFWSSVTPDKTFHIFYTFSNGSLATILSTRDVTPLHYSAVFALQEFLPLENFHTNIHKTVEQLEDCYLGSHASNCMKFLIRYLPKAEVISHIHNFTTMTDLFTEGTVFIEVFKHQNTSLMITGLLWEVVSY